MNMLLLLIAVTTAEPVDLFPTELTEETVRLSTQDDDGSIAIEGDAVTVDSSTGDLKQPWLNQAIVRTTGPIARGDVLLLTVPLELLGTGDDALEDGVGKVKVNLTHEPAEGDNQFGLKYDEVSFSGPMQEYHTPIIAETDVPAGEGRFAAHFSRQAQQLKMGLPRLRNYGPGYPLEDLPRNDITYQGREPDAAWRDAAAARIAEHRTGPIRIKAVDESGQPVEGADVHFKLQRHAFGFGSAIQFPILGATEDEFPLKFWGKDTWCWDDAQKYRATVKKLFNKVVFEAATRPNVWPGLHNPAIDEWPANARKHQLQLMRTFAFLDENKIDARGHYLSWGAIDHPPQTRFVGKPKEHWAYQTRIAKEHPIQLGTRVVEWDALNHPCGWGLTMEELHGGLELHVETMRIARENAPEGVKLYVNEGHVLHERSQVANYERIIKRLVDDGVGPDGIGFMGHFTDKTLTGMDEAFKIFERFAPYADHLQITEFDVSAAQDLRLHADYVRDMLTLAYSHPKMAGVVQWGFWENAHWKPETALYFADWTAKPAADEWDRLVNDEWRTFEQGQTDEDGLFSATGCHHGDYEVYAHTADLESWQIVENATRYDTNDGTLLITLTPKDTSDKQ